jgi:hypothetical protein
LKGYLDKKSAKKATLRAEPQARHTKAYVLEQDEK